MERVKDILEDQKFYDLPESERVKVLQRVDPNFMNLPEQEQLKVVTARSPRQFSPSPESFKLYEDMMASQTPGVVLPPTPEGLSRIASKVYRPVLEGGKSQ